jgi:hypothetical protein
MVYILSRLPEMSRETPRFSTWCSLLAGAEGGKTKRAKQKSGVVPRIHVCGVEPYVGNANTKQMATPASDAPCQH